jgi:hypothetical protein
MKLLQWLRRPPGPKMGTLVNYDDEAHYQRVQAAYRQACLAAQMKGERPPPPPAPPMEWSPNY